MDRDQAEQFVSTLYRSLLLREADPDGLESYVTQITSENLALGSVVQSFVSSAEFNSLWMRKSRPATDTYSFDKDPLISKFATADVPRTSARLKASQEIGIETFRKYVAEMSLRNDGYINLQEYRFVELMNHFSTLYPDGTHSAKAVLDIGHSAFSTLFRAHFNIAVMDCLDRPGGRTVGDNSKLYEVDLQDPEEFEKFSIDVRYDFIMFTQVLEHLIVNPTRLISFIATLLNDDGFLYISTPNFFSYHTTHKINTRRNPQPTFWIDRGKKDLWKFHVREYCMSELLQICHASGLKVHAFLFSQGRESNPARWEALSQDLLPNLVVVARKA